MLEKPGHIPIMSDIQPTLSRNIRKHINKAVGAYLLTEILTDILKCAPFSGNLYNLALIKHLAESRLTINCVRT